MGCPFTEISPELGISKKFRQRRRVVLPPPEGPITDMVSPLSMEKLIPLRTCSSSKLLYKSFTSSSAMSSPHTLK